MDDHARNIEANSSNWSGGSVGSGGLYVGHNDSSPGNTLNINNNADPYDQTLNAATDAYGAGGSQRRTQTLSNGSVIWDFAGNSSEWVADTIVGSAQTPSLAGAPGGNVQYSNAALFDFAHVTNRYLFAPLAADPTHYDSTHGTGRLNRGVNGGIFRGGDYNSGVLGGIYFANIFFAPTQTLPTASFRCVTTVR